MTARLMLRILTGVTLLIAVLQFVDMGEVARSLRNVQPLWLAAAGACFLATRLLMGVKWWVLLGGPSSTVSYAVVQRAIFLSDFYSLMFPNSVAVDVTRIVLLRHHESGVAFATATIVADRLANVAITAATSLLAVGFLWFWKGHAPFSTPAIQVVIGLALMVVMACVIVTSPGVMNVLMGLARRLTRIAPGSVWLNRTLRAATKIHASTVVMLTTQRTAIPVIALSCLFLLARVGSIYFLFYAIGEPQPFVITLALVPIILLIVLLPVSLFGLGLKEGAFVFFFGSAGVSPSVALAASLTSYFVVIGGNFLFGAVASFVGPSLPKPSGTSTLNSRTGDTS